MTQRFVNFYVLIPMCYTLNCETLLGRDSDYTGTILRNFVRNDVSTPEVELENNFAIIRFVEEVLFQFNHVAAIIRTESVGKFFERSPVLRTCVSATCISGFHGGQLIAIKGCRNRKRARCARYIAQFRRIILDDIQVPVCAFVEFDGQLGINPKIAGRGQSA